MIYYDSVRKNIDLAIYFENPNQMGFEVEELIDLLSTHITNTYCKDKSKSTKFKNDILDYIATTANKLKGE